MKILKLVILFFMFFVVLFSCNNSPENKTTIYTGKVYGSSRVRIGIDTFPCDKKPDYILFLGQYDGYKPPPELKNEDSITIIYKDGISSISPRLSDNYSLDGISLVKDLYRGRIISFLNHPNGFRILDENKQIRTYKGITYEDIKLNDSIIIARTFIRELEYVIYFKL